ncbi:ran GTPase-activating protein 1 [Tribolium madens]|uniref:ran GTPase-activating protein 1 n=1 Tax=Tribolium madens TaxID=41895 RepID=UPI001CF7521A|nr:ran GTPase-activating protein 1 [Tribolium madens]
MTNTNVDDLTNALQGTRVSPSGVTFAGQSLKLDTVEDAKSVIEEIEKCTNLQFLNLEGNTLGVEASKGIAKTLEKHPEFKRALWKDMFTGRMKTEIPKALEFLGSGLVTAGARLTELDMSDNAFGPIGVEGLAALLRSSSCYALEELKLNNNGLGITGGKLLASALTDCYNSSKETGKPLQLKVFIAGRNRLENDGAKALAEVFKMIGTLEEIAMPQNGIYHIGISALSEAFTQNKNLQILNLNDNTIGEKGAEAIAKALPHLQQLKEINFGDCLLKTAGAISLADALKTDHANLEELTLGHNEIRLKGGLQLVKAMANKSKLKVLNLNGNQFGEEGRKQIENEIKQIGKLNSLGSLSEDESEDSEEESSEEVSHTESDMEEEIIQSKTASDFLNSPTEEIFIALGDARNELILREAKKGDDIDVNIFIPVLMKVASLANSSKENVSTLALSCSERLYKELFSWSEKTNNSCLVNNTILVHLGLIKSEDKKFKPTWNMDACAKALRSVMDKNYVTEITKNTFTVFLQKDKSGSR